MTDFVDVGNVAPSGLLPGFGDPVTGAQRTFRSLLQALSHPGTVVSLRDEATRTSVPPRLSTAMTALLLTLVDSDTPLWLPDDVPEATRQFLRFHCGCPFATTPAKARFAAVPAGFAVPALSACDQGDPAYPDRSTTLIVEVEALASLTPAQIRDGEPAYTLSGPGIEHTRQLALHGLPAGFLSQWRGNQQHFPLGVDVFFSCGTTVSGLPRTTRLEI